RSAARPRGPPREEPEHAGGSPNGAPRGGEQPTVVPCEVSSSKNRFVSDVQVRPGPVSMTPSVAKGTRSRAVGWDALAYERRGWCERFAWTRSRTSAGRPPRALRPTTRALHLRREFSIPPQAPRHAWRRSPNAGNERQVV